MKHYPLQLMLKLQLQLGFKAFEAKYGDVECGLNISNGNFCFVCLVFSICGRLNIEFMKQVKPCLQK